jgi:hypothetical protein
VAVEEPEEDDRLAVDRDPEDIEAVVTEAVDLALEASSFTTYDFFFTNDIGHDPANRYLYTEEPEPALSRLEFFGPASRGTLALGANLDETVYIAPPAGQSFSEHEFVYYRDPGPNAEPTESPRTEWETLLRLMEELLTGDAEVTYEGQDMVLEPGEEWHYPEEILGDVDPEERGGHHYTGILTHEMSWTRTVQETDFELWISEKGEPVRLVLTALDGEGRIAESGEHLTFNHHIDFFRFNEPVEVAVPNPSEIHEERP